MRLRKSAIATAYAWGARAAMLRTDDEDAAMVAAGMDEVEPDSPAYRACEEAYWEGQEDASWADTIAGNGHEVALRAEAYASALT